MQTADSMQHKFLRKALSNYSILVPQLDLVRHFLEALYGEV
jgi:hypothetical protein